jgi:NAD(P)-dependent dehydrogenase (short-subunit alcohol dehydrogenase family)
MTFEDCYKVINVNINGTFRVTQAVGQEMIKRLKGKIRNISSYAGNPGTAPLYPNAISYNTSRGAVNAFTQNLAVKRAQYSINLNAVAPGWFPTKMSAWSFEHGREILLSRIAMKRYGKMEDLMGVAVFPDSAPSDCITGRIIPVDGGLTAW